MQVRGLLKKEMKHRLYSVIFIHSFIKQIHLEYLHFLGTSLDERQKPCSVKTHTGKHTRKLAILDQV